MMDPSRFVTDHVDASGLRQLLSDGWAIGEDKQWDRLLLHLAIVEAWSEHFLNRDARNVLQRKGF